MTSKLNLREQALPVQRDWIAETVVTSSAATLTLTAANSCYVFTGSAPTTWSLLPVAGNVGVMHILENRGSAAITLTAVGADHIWLGASIVSMTIAAGGSLMVVNDGTYWNALSVDLANNCVGLLPVASGGTGANTLAGAGIEVLSHKGAANGYAGLGATSVVPTAQLGTGAANSGSFLRGDQSWQYVSPAVYTATIGNGSLTTFTINHNLGTRNVTVVVYNAATYEVVNCDKFLTDLNNVTLTFATAPATNAYAVVVLGGAMPSNTSVYTQTIGDGSTTVFTINHNLGTRAVTVNLYNASTFAMCSADRVLTSVNSLTLTFQTAPALNSLVVVVQGGIISGLSSTAITDATSIGRALLTAASTGAAQTAIGATTAGSNLLTAASAAAALATMTPLQNAQSAYVATSESTTSGSFADLATTTDQVTVNIGASGMALVLLYAMLTNNVTGDYAYCGFALSGANTATAIVNQALQYAATGVNVPISFGAPFLLTGLTQGATTFKMKYAVFGGTASFQYRRIAVIPL
jgi:hypothetical protein